MQLNVLKKDMAKKTITDKLRENPWILSTLFLGIVFIIISIPIDDNEKIDYEIMNPFSDIEICSKISGTPSWVSVNGSIITSGYKQFPIGSEEEIVNNLIKDQIYFVYHEDCIWCKRQIEYFNQSWDKYVSSGFTINCKEVGK